MASLFLRFQNVSFTYPSMTRPLLVGLDLQVGCGWTGVVGANGVGKSTFLRLAVGDLLPQRGTVHHLGSARYCSQRTDEPPEGLGAWLDAADREAIVLRQQLEARAEWLDRWETLSHGERKRAQIGVALWQRPDVLALDEPTNHIDQATREKLQAALRRHRGVGLLVSHDRDLLDELCTQCLFLEPPTAVMRPGGVSTGLAQDRLELETTRRRDDEAKHAIDRLRREGQRRREAADQFAAKTKSAKLRKPPAQDHDGRARRNLAKLTGKDAFAGKLAAAMGERARRAAAERAATGVRKVYETGIWLAEEAASSRDFLCRLPPADLLLGPGPRRLSHPGLALGPTDHVAITGPNGSGKSTLVRHLLEHVQVEAERLVYIPQEVAAEASRGLLATVAALPKERLGRIMTLVSRLGSRPQRLLESEEPSPGETRKILLALGLARGPHLIVMDEPTNHMDLPSIECLEEALADCPCGLVLVSHDQRFLRALTTRHWELTVTGETSQLRLGTW